jgi:hypothetical protein
VTAVAGSTLLGSVPTNFTWLLKDVRVFNASGVAVNIVLYMQTASGAVQARVYTWDLANSEAGSWSGWTTLGPNDQLLVATTPGVHLWISGAELPGAIP